MKKQRTNAHLNCKEAAEYIRMSEEWLALQRKHGYAPAYYKLGTARNAPIRYSKIDLDDYLNTMKVKVA